MAAIPSLILGALGSMATKLLTEKFVQWGIMQVIKAYVKSTKNTHDDEIYTKIAELIGK